MAKYYGAIGFAETTETAPDVWAETIIERNYSGEMLRTNPRLQNGQQVNDNFTVNHRVSIISDPYATSHLGSIRYVTWHGIKWKVTGADIQYPRLVLNIGDLYNEGGGESE